MNTQLTLALVGQTNVGKSTLFNRLTNTRNALVADIAGLTRDRQYGHFYHKQQTYRIIDTGGLTKTKEGFNPGIDDQVQAAIERSDVILFLVSALQGITSIDKQIGQQLRQQNKAILLLVNKSEGISKNQVLDCYTLGLGEPIAISATKNKGIDLLMAALAKHQALAKTITESKSDSTIVALLGKPNTGKSTLINQLSNQNRLITSATAGSTRDSIAVDIKHKNKTYTFVDTAGIRRHKKTNDYIEKLSIVKAKQSVQHCHVVLLLLDAHSGIADQDATLLGMVIDYHKPLIIAVNKWDKLDSYQRLQVKEKLTRKLAFAQVSNVLFISAQYRKGIDKIFSPIDKAYQQSCQQFPTSLLNNALQQVIKQHQPPMHQSRRIKLKFINQVSQKPPKFIIHGNLVEHLTKSYQAYLNQALKKALKLQHTPITIEFKSAENPFAGKKNTLSTRQINKRKRMIKFVKR